jgi:acetoacetyl-CoA synthetase
MGIRMGTSEIYRAVENMPEVLDSLVLDVDLPGKPSFMPLFVVLREGLELDEDMKKAIKASVRQTLSPRHVPDDVIAVPDVPRTLSGKKLEIPVKKLFMGMSIQDAANLDAMKNPDVIPFYAELAAKFRQGE